MTTPSTRTILNQFPGLGRIDRIESLANAGGFSGSEMWRVSADRGELCLRLWPEETAAERLAFIHRFQRHLLTCGLSFIPSLVAACDGKTSVEVDGRLWELATWMPGRADFRDDPTLARLAAAMQALAKIHIVAARMPGESRVDHSPGLAARLDQLRQLQAGGIERIESAIARRPLGWDCLAERIIRGIRRFAPGLEAKLEHGVSLKSKLFPCLRDVWHDHVLFSGDEVTGVIDFGAASVETPAGDIARLVGSLVGDDRDSWDAALAAYQSVRALDAKEHQLTRDFDASSVLLSGSNWLMWLYVEGRRFEDAARVMRRLEEIVARLDHIATVGPDHQI